MTSKDVIPILQKCFSLNASKAVVNRLILTDHFRIYLCGTA